MQPKNEIKSRRRTAIESWLSDPIIDLRAFSNHDEDKEFLHRWERLYHRWHQRKVDAMDKAEASKMGLSLEEYREQDRHLHYSRMAMREAENLLIHYFEMAIPNLGGDCQEEIRSIVTAITDAARKQAQADAIIKAGQARKNQPFI